MRGAVMTAFILAASLMASSIHMTIDELLDKEQTKELELPKYDPFKRAKPLLVRKLSKAPVAKPRRTELVAILNEKAFINGRWYQKDDELMQGRVYKITDESVYIKQGKKIKILRLKKEKRLLEISEKDHK